jgi:hypothetical protein
MTSSLHDERFQQPHVLLEARQRRDFIADARGILAEASILEHVVRRVAQAFWSQVSSGDHAAHPERSAPQCRRKPPSSTPPLELHRLGLPLCVAGQRPAPRRSACRRLTETLRNRCLARLRTRTAQRQTPPRALPAQPPARAAVKRIRIVNPLKFSSARDALAVGNSALEPRPLGGRTGRVAARWVVLVGRIRTSAR